MTKAIVTGGTGFLGKALVQKLVRDGVKVTALSRGVSKNGAPIAGAEYKNLNLGEITVEELAEVFSGASVVFHTAAHVEMWGKYEDFYKSNVVATQNVLDACLKAKVKKLVFTSSPSVIASGKNLRHVNESIPYPSHYNAHYPRTKAEAEKRVIEIGVSTENDLRTIVLRPHLIFGPGDTNLEPTILDRARKKRLVQIGKGTNLVDLCHIDDCVEAHLCAAQALDKNSALSGAVYFISQDNPVKLWDWINHILRKNGLPPVRKKISVRTALILATLFEGIAKVIPFFTPPFTKFLVEEMATDHYFDISAAKRELEFTPTKRELL